MNRPSSPESFFGGLRYEEGDTFLHHTHPLVKLGLLIAFSVAVFASLQWWQSCLLTLALLAVYHCGGLGFGFFWRKLRVILVFGLMLFLVQAIFRTGGVLFVEFDLGFTQLHIWSEGLAQGLLMALRFVNVIAASYVFVATTNPNEFALGLMQAGLPYRHGFMLIAALRFIPVFQHELGQIRAAQMAKGIDLRRLSLSKLLMVMRYLFMPLVVSALTKVDTLTVSMEGRAFGLYGERTYRRKLPVTSRDKWVFALGLLLICSLHFGSWWLRLRL